MFVSIESLFLLGIIIFGAQPPVHCRFLVPVETKPGIYACSEFPHAKVKP